VTTREVIDGIFGAAATGDLDEVMRWWAPDGILEDVTIAQAFHGRHAIRDYLEMYYRALPDVTYTPIRVVVEGPSAVVEWAQATTIAAAFDGTRSTGRTVFLHAVDVFHVEGGLVRHEASWYGDGWLRERLDAGTVTAPPPLPVTPAIVAPGLRFGS
jgi:uncharacterized protein (TIGR02246 family)